MLNPTDRRPSRSRRPRPRPEGLKLGSQPLMLGIVAAVGGLAGSVRSAMDGAGMLQILAQLAVGLLGLALAIACVVEYSKK